MKKHKRAIKITLIILAAIIVIPVGLYVFGNLYDTDARIFEGNWNIALPAGIQEEYSKNGSMDFQGHGSRYAVFQLKDVHSPFLSDFTESKNRGMEFAISSILSDIGADKSRCPAFSDSYKWKMILRNNNRLYMVYDTKTSLLFLTQDIP